VKYLQKLKALNVRETVYGGNWEVFAEKVSGVDPGAGASPPIRKYRGENVSKSVTMSIYL